MALTVKIISRGEKIYDGTCQTVTSHNEVGEFDILPIHANFISLIQRYVILNKGQENELWTSVEHGILRCSEDDVEVYVQT